MNSAKLLSDLDKMEIRLTKFSKEVFGCVNTKSRLFSMIHYSAKIVRMMQLHQEGDKWPELFPDWLLYCKMYIDLQDTVCGSFFKLDDIEEISRVLEDFTNFICNIYGNQWLSEYIYTILIGGFKIELKARNKEGGVVTFVLDKNSTYILKLLAEGKLNVIGEKSLYGDKTVDRN